MPDKDIDILGMIDVSSGVNKELQEEVFHDMSQIQDLSAFLKEMMSEDIKRYFNATTPMEQLITKGAYFRTKWMLGRLSTNVNPAKKKVGLKNKIARYAE